MSETSIPTTKVEVLTRFRQRLLDELSEFTDSTLILSTQAEPPANVDHNLFATVAPTDGQFDASVLEGGGGNTVFYEGGIAVTLFSKIRLGRVGHETSLMNDPIRGLFVLEQLILKALAGYMLTNETGHDILTEHIAPLRDTTPNSAADKKPGDIQVTFAVNFEWNMG